jgi:hypothetical protein
MFWFRKSRASPGGRSGLRRKRFRKCTFPGEFPRDRAPTPSGARNPCGSGAIRRRSSGRSCESTPRARRRQRRSTLRRHFRWPKLRLSQAYRRTGQKIESRTGTPAFTTKCPRKRMRKSSASGGKGGSVYGTGVDCALVGVQSSAHHHEFLGQRGHFRIEFQRQGEIGQRAARPKNQSEIPHYSPGRSFPIANLRAD